MNVYAQVCMCVALLPLMTLGKDFFADDSMDDVDFSNIFSQGKCEYKCSNGAKPTVNKDFKRTQKTCGRMGQKYAFFEGVPEVTSCCDSLFTCYEDCGTAKGTCDNEFKDCLTEYCDEVSKEGDKEKMACQSTQMLMNMNVLAMGCDAYKAGQKAACTCNKSSNIRVEEL